MKFSKSLAAIALVGCMFTAQAQASLVDLGYSLDEDSNIITDNDGLEWLQWDVTVGQTIEGALAEHGKDGWVLASNIQVAGLFDDAFGLSANDLIQAGDESRAWSRSISISTKPRMSEFISMFGETFSDSDNGAFALHGADEDADGRYNEIYVHEYYGVNALDSIIYLGPDYIPSSRALANVGVALVRSSVSPVPVPNSLLLFGTALAGFGWVRRKKSRQ